MEKIFSFFPQQSAGPDENNSEEVDSPKGAKKGVSMSGRVNSSEVAKHGLTMDDLRARPAPREDLLALATPALASSYVAASSVAASALPPNRGGFYVNFRLLMNEEFYNRHASLKTGGAKNRPGIGDGGRPSSGSPNQPSSSTSNLTSVRQAQSTNQPTPPAGGGNTGGPTDDNGGAESLSAQDAEFGKGIEIGAGYLHAVPLAGGGWGLLQLRVGGGATYQFRRGDFIDPEKAKDEFIWLHSLGLQGKIGIQYNPVEMLGIVVMGNVGVRLAFPNSDWPNGDALGRMDDVATFERLPVGAEAGLSIADQVYVFGSIERDVALTGNSKKVSGDTYENIGYDSVTVYGLGVGIQL